MSSGSFCGFSSDCAPNYLPEALNISVSAWALCNSTHNSHEFEKRWRRAKSACTNNTQGKKGTGGFCLPRLERGDPPHVSAGQVRLVDLPNNQSFLLPYNPTFESTNYVEADGRVIAVLAALASTSSHHGLFLNDFGAGVGQYGRKLLAMRPQTQYRGYDAAGNVNEWTRGFVRWFDLTIPLSLARAQWVLSLEVGEHVPHKFEGHFLRNVHAHNCAGVILSWARLGQTGAQHINNHKEEYLRVRMHDLGYFVNETLTNRLRSNEALAGMPEYLTRTVHRYITTNIVAYQRYSKISPCTPRPLSCK